MKYIAITVMILCGLACVETQEKELFDAEAVVKEVRLMFENYHRDINKQGFAAEFKYLDSTKQFFWIPPGYQTPISYDSVKTILIQTDKTMRSVKFEMKDLKVRPLSNKIATYSGKVNGQSIDTSGVEVQVSIIESGTLIKRKDGWKLLSGQSRLLEDENSN